MKIKTSNSFQWNLNFKLYIRNLDNNLIKNHEEKK